MFLWAIILLFNCLFLLFKPCTFYLSPHCFSDNESPSKHILNRNRKHRLKRLPLEFQEHSKLTGVKSERTDGQFLGVGVGRKAERALLWLESQIFVNVWDAGKMCPWAKDSVGPKAGKSYLDYLFLFYSLCVTLVPYFSSQHLAVLKYSLFAPQHEN